VTPQADTSFGMSAVLCAFSKVLFGHKGQSQNAPSLLDGVGSRARGLCEWGAGGMPAHCCSRCTHRAAAGKH